MVSDFHLRTVFVNAGLSGIRSARYQNGKECRCRNQSGTGIKGTQSGIGMLRYQTEMSNAGNADAGGISHDADAQLCYEQSYLALAGCSARPALFFCSHLYIEN